jgi:hypothetical protein
MTNNRNGKEQAARINHLLDFIERKSESKFPRSFIQDILLVFASMYDLHALLSYFERALERRESEDTILETIMHDLYGIKQNPETFHPHSAETHE